MHETLSRTQDHAESDRAQHAVGAAAARLLHLITPARHLIIHGFYGAGNVGDELILRATIKAFGERTELEPLVFAWRPENVRQELGVKVIDPRRASRWTMTRVLAGAGLFLLGGGGLIKDYGGSPASLKRWLRWIDVAARTGIPTATWAIGVDPLRYTESRTRVREVFGRLGVVSVRDRASAERLAEIGVEREVLVGADPVHVLTRPDDRRRPAQGPPLVVISLRHWFVEADRTHDPAAFEQLLTSLAALGDALRERHDARIAYIPFRTSSGDDDRAVARKVTARMATSGDAVQIVDAITPDEVANVLARADLVVAMRLHAAIIATSLGIPTLGIGYAPKVVDYMAAIDQSEHCRSVEDATSAWLAETADRLLGDRERISAALIEQTSARARHVEEIVEAITGLLPHSLAISRSPSADNDPS